jgi:hypothetical protein
MNEIHKLLEHPDRRIKIIVLTMISSGMPAGSWDYLQWKHVIPIKRNSNIIGAKLSPKSMTIITMNQDGHTATCKNFI